MRAIAGALTAGRRFVAAWALVLLSVLAASWSGRAAADAAPRADDARYGVPPDQPRVIGRTLELPAPPPSFSTVDAGWIHFSYAPSTRARVEPLMAAADS